MFIRLMLIAQDVLRLRGYREGKRRGRESAKSFGSPTASSIIGPVGFCASVASP
jgi:hypothetical protein